MDKKLLCLILIAIFVLVCGTYFAFAALSYVVESPTANRTEYYNSCPFTINVTSNSTISMNMTIYVNDSSNQGKPTFKVQYGNQTTNGTHTFSWNVTALCFSASGTPSGKVAGPAPFYLPERWIQILLNSTTNRSSGAPFQNFTWTNTTPTNGLQFYINEREPQTVSITPYSVKNENWKVITNNSYWNYGDLNISIITNVTIAYCQEWNNTNTSLVGDITEGINMTPTNTSYRTIFTNYTNVENGMGSWNDTDFNGTAQKITWMCQDAFGNKSWYNNSATAGFLNFYVDTVNPVLLYTNITMAIRNTTRLTIETATNETLYFGVNASYATLVHSDAISISSAGNISDMGMAGNFSVSSDKTKIQLASDGKVIAGQSYVITYTYNGYDVVSTTEGNYINFTFSVFDHNHNIAWVKIFYPDGTTAQLAATSKSAAFGGGVKDNLTYEVNITPQYLTKNGVYRFQAFAQDLAGRNGSAGVNKTLMISNLKANKWNPAIFYENVTLGNISSRSRNISYVSYFSNQFGYKNFTTFQVGLATYNTFLINQSDAVLIYPSENIVLIRIIYNATTDIFPTLNLTTGGWNFIAMDANYNATAVNQLIGQKRFNLNESMYGGVVGANNACQNKTILINNQTEYTLVNYTWNAINAPKIVSISNIGNETFNFPSTNITWNSTHIFINETTNAGKIAFDLKYNITYTRTEQYTFPFCANITYVSYYNTTSGLWCSAKRGMSITSCSGFTATNLYPPLDQGFWILTNTNMTYDREAVGWYDAR